MGAKTFIATVLVAAGVCGSGASAHHSYAMFDMTKVDHVDMTVAKLEWANPHVFVWGYVRDAQGKQQLYAFESDAIARLTRMGWSQDVLAAGQKVTIDFAPLRDGRPGGKLHRVKFADGKVLSTTEAPPQARPAP